MIRTLSSKSIKFLKGVLSFHGTKKGALQTKPEITNNFTAEAQETVRNITNCAPSDHST